jgi:hypothetical protein
MDVYLIFVENLFSSIFYIIYEFIIEDSKIFNNKRKFLFFSKIYNIFLHECFY